MSQEPQAAAPTPNPVAVARTSAESLTFAAPRRGKAPRHLADLDAQQRRAAVIELGHPAFRANQLSSHYFVHHTRDPNHMTDLPKAARADLVDALLPVLVTPIRTVASDSGATRKTVWRLHDGALVESVLMRYPRRITICISSQAGCGMNCPFCATGQAGLTRNLSTAEIVEQVVASQLWLHTQEREFPQYAARGRALGDDDDLDAPGHSDNRASAEDATSQTPEGDPSSPILARVTNVVFMGMGEALANYSASIGAIKRMTDPSPAGLGLSARSVTMSTVGLVPAIHRLATEGLPVTLALSLHAPDDALRDDLVPINTRWRVSEALDAARAYFEATGRRVSIEYALIRDINDQAWRADLLGKLLNSRGRGWVHVNPIPLNPTPGSKWTASRPGVEQQFVERLRAHGIPTTVRDTRGSDIDGACGQLAAVSS